ncbi:MAG: DUF3854 domain-containing protein [Cyanobacteriota bacterium]|nr:DUF3854 domain-containing protein [Cyanobacteriota bacterium]
MNATTQPAPLHTPQASPTPSWWAELIDGSGIAPDVAAANVAAFGPGTDRHWESERAALIRHKRLAIQTTSTTGKGLPQAQPGHLADALINLQRRYGHLAAGGWRTTSAGLPGLPTFDQWKPNRPRLQQKAKGFGATKAIKYEAPPGFPDGGGALLPHVPERCWQLICQRQGIPFPDQATRAGGFWPWVLATPTLELLLCEGWKKALAALACGYAAIALPGVQMGRRRRPDGTERLIAELQALAATGRHWLIAFDAEAKPSTAHKVAAAAGALARSLRTAGGQVAIARLPLLPGTDKTGIDDLLVAGGREALDRALANVGPRAVLPRLRVADRVAGAGRHLSDALDPAQLARHRLVVAATAMGTGKTRLAREQCAPLLTDGIPVLAPTHRTALGEAQAEAIGIPWAAMPGTDARLQGTGLCWDSFRPSSALAINPADWGGTDGRGPFLLLDEISQGIEHVLFGTGTAVAEHRPATMAAIADAHQRMRGTLALDAQLHPAVLQLLETLSGERAYLIRSDHQPMAGRRVVVPQGLTARTAAEQARAHVLRLAKAGKRAFVITTAQQAHAKGSAQNLAQLVRRHQIGTDPLVVDSEHPEAAERLGADPNGTAATHGWIIASPSITSGLSIDAPGLFDEVVVIGAGGRLTCEHLAQAAARVRDPRCPVTIYTPSIAPQLRIGSGDTTPAELLRHLARCEAQLLADLVGTAGWDSAATNESPWLRCWLELAAHRNRQSHAYSATIAGLLEAEGWAVETPAADQSKARALVEQATAELQEIADAAIADADQAVITAEPISDREAAELTKRRRLSSTDRARLQRHRIAAAWGLGTAAPTPELLEAGRDGLNRRLRFGWILQTIKGRQLAASHDRRRREQLAPNGKGWAPDLVRELLGHKLAAADALGLPSWLNRREWFSAADAHLLELQAIATAHAGTMAAALGITAGKRASGTLRALLRLAGCRLEARRRRNTNGDREWFYRVAPEPLPVGANQHQLEAAWTDQLCNPAAITA